MENPPVIQELLAQTTGNDYDRHVYLLIFIWASSGENLSSGFPTKQVANQTT